MPVRSRPPAWLLAVMTSPIPSACERRMKGNVPAGDCFHESEPIALVAQRKSSYDSCNASGCFLLHRVRVAGSPSAPADHFPERPAGELHDVGLRMQPDGASD